MAVTKRMQWRCRRGLRELDLVFGRFLEQGFDTLPAEELGAFERLLDQNDLDLYDWLLGRSLPPSEEFRRLIARLNGRSV
ncbi:MAG: succinate dehydrogenase assembly factor 2 [Gammaproteobacteria bacterium]